MDACISIALAVNICISIVPACVALPSVDLKWIFVRSFSSAWMRPLGTYAVAMPAWTRSAPFNRCPVRARNTPKLFGSLGRKYEPAKAQVNQCEIYSMSTNSVLVLRVHTTDVREKACNDGSKILQIVHDWESHSFSMYSIDAQAAVATMCLAVRTNCCLRHRKETCLGADAHGGVNGYSDTSPHTNSCIMSPCK
jgi:hypothetical protein